MVIYQITHWAPFASDIHRAKRFTTEITEYPRAREDDAPADASRTRSWHQSFGDPCLKAVYLDNILAFHGSSFL